LLSLEKPFFAPVLTIRTEHLIFRKKYVKMATSSAKSGGTVGEDMKYIAILGLGVVGSGTADLFSENAAGIASRLGDEVALKYVLDVRDLPESPYADKIVHDIKQILEDPEVSVVAELIGGVHPAYDFTRACLEAGKSVVTSNKELVATKGAELLKLANEKGVFYLFEASTGGAIPVIRPLCTDLAANTVTGISGILNGTTNYILTRMFRSDASFEAALTEAQEKGYAERNPAADIEGLDACRKICILAATVTGTLVDPNTVHTEGITAIRQSDVQLADRMGYTVKLLGRFVRQTGGTFVMVAPFWVPQSSPLSGIEDVFNGILVECNYAGDVMFYGRGAGAHPTASAVAADILSALRGDAPRQTWESGSHTMPTDFRLFGCRHYISLRGVEQSAVNVVWSEAEILPGQGDEIACITPAITEQECEDDLKRLGTLGAQLQAHIRVLD
jgi:homoserine dehydrogenase